MTLSGFVDIVSFRANNPVDDPSRLDPIPFVWREDPEVFRQIVDRLFHWPGSSAPRKFGQHDAATNNKLEIQDLLLSARM